MFSADFNGDTYSDLAVVNFQSNDISVLLNNTDGTFAPAVDYSVGSGPYTVFGADFDGDGDTDLAVANYSSNDVSILFNLDIHTCCDTPGDADNNQTVDISDLTFYVTYMFGTGPAPDCLEEADNDGNCTLDISDLTYFVDYLFGGGPPPVDCHRCAR